MFVHISHCKKRLNALLVVINTWKVDGRIFNKFREFTEIKSYKIYDNITRRFDRKLHGLKKNEYIMQKHKRENWLKNLSSVIIPQEVTDVVSLGPNFNIKRNLTKKDIITTVKNIEYSCDKKILV